MPITDRDERRTLGIGLLALAVSAGALAASLGVISQAHMVGAANLCASPNVHCLACYGAVVALATTLMTGGAGMSFMGSPDEIPSERKPAPEVHAIRI
ncbi:MAG: hypothetical protein DCF28_02030 [Alphaproteobacteria bacterium]|nr:MAG: hypothetical protein DCF28_02030 [Alphaproteobacteria bacterium]PZO38620.1 MAG: hypothetical protein DCE92_05700 [Alphaproteobacteria bacterium]